MDDDEPTLDLDVGDDEMWCTPTQHGKSKKRFSIFPVLLKAQSDVLPMNEEERIFAQLRKLQQMQQRRQRPLDGEVSSVPGACKCGFKHFYEGKEYDYVFQVPITKGKPHIIAMQATDNPYAVSQYFVEKFAISEGSVTQQAVVNRLAELIIVSMKNPPPGDHGPTGLVMPQMGSVPQIRTDDVPNSNGSLPSPSVTSPRKADRPISPKPLDPEEEAKRQKELVEAEEARSKQVEETRKRMKEEEVRKKQEKEALRQQFNRDREEREAAAKLERERAQAAASSATPFSAYPSRPVASISSPKSQEEAGGIRTISDFGRGSPAPQPIPQEKPSIFNSKEERRKTREMYRKAGKSHVFLILMMRLSSGESKEAIIKSLVEQGWPEQEARAAIIVTEQLYMRKSKRIGGRTIPVGFNGSDNSSDEDDPLFQSGIEEYEDDEFEEDLNDSPAHGRGFQRRVPPPVIRAAVNQPAPRQQLHGNTLGGGHTLGGQTLGGVVTGSGQALGGHTLLPSANTSATAESVVIGRELVFDSSAPSTTIQVRLASGAPPLRLAVNQSHTVNDIHAHLVFLNPACGPFTLMTSFPKKVLEEMTATVKEAGLLNAVIIQTFR